MFGTLEDGAVMLKVAHHTSVQAYDTNLLQITYQRRQTPCRDQSRFATGPNVDLDEPIDYRGIMSEVASS